MSDSGLELALLEEYKKFTSCETSYALNHRQLDFEAYLDSVKGSIINLQPKVKVISHKRHQFLAIFNTEPHLILLVKNENINTIEIFDYQTSKLIRSVKTDMNGQETKLNYVSSDDKLLILQYGTYTYFYDIQTLTRIYETQDTYEQCADKDENNVICVKDLGSSLKIDIFDRNELTLQKYECLFKIKNIECISGNYLASIETEQYLKIWRYGETITQISELKLNAISAQFSRKEHYLAIHAPKGQNHFVILYNILTHSSVSIQIPSTPISYQFPLDEQTLIILDDTKMLTYYYINTGKKFTYQLHSSESIQHFFISHADFGIIGLCQDSSLLTLAYANFNDVPFKESDGINVISPEGYRFYILSNRVSIYSLNDICTKILLLQDIKKAFFGKNWYIYSTKEVYSIDKLKLLDKLILSSKSLYDEDILDFYADDDTCIAYVLTHGTAYLYNLQSSKTVSYINLNSQMPVGLDLTHRCLYAFFSNYKNLLFRYDLNSLSSGFNQSSKTYTLSGFELMRNYKDTYYLIATSLPEVEVRDAQTRELKIRIAVSEKVSNILFLEDYALIQEESGVVTWYNMTYRINVFKMILPSGIQTVYLSADRQFMYVNSSEKSFKYKYPLSNEDFYIYGCDEQTVDIMNTLYEISKTTKTRMTPNSKHCLISPGPTRMSDFYLHFNIPSSLKICLKNDPHSIFDLREYSVLDWAIEKRDAFLGIIITATIRFIKYSPEYSLKVSKYFTKLNNTGHPLLDQLYDHFYIKVHHQGIPKACSQDVHLPISNLSSQFKITPKDFISESNLAKKGQMIEFKSFSIPLNYSLGSTESMEFLKNILYCKNQTIFDTDFIQTYVNRMWEDARWVLIVQGVVYGIYIVALCYVISTDEVITEVFNATIGINTLLLAIEILQIMSSRIGYIKDVWNWIDFSRSILFYAYAYCLYNEVPHNVQYVILATLALLSFVKGISYFRVNQKTRYFVSLLFEVIKDMSAFVAILLYTIISYCFIYLTLYYDDTDKTKPFSETISPTFGLLFGNLPDETNDVFSLSINALFLLLNPIIMFNLLISILGETYDRVKAKSTIADTIELVELILEASQLLFWNRNKTDKYYYQVCMKPASYYEVEDPTQVKLNTLSTRAYQIDKKVNEITNFKNEISILNQSWNRKIHSFDEKLKEIYKLIIKDS